MTIAGVGQDIESGQWRRGELAEGAAWCGF